MTVPNRLSTTTTMYIILGCIYTFLIACLIYKKYKSNLIERLDREKLRNYSRIMNKKIKITPVFMPEN